MVSSHAGYGEATARSRFSNRQERRLFALCVGHLPNACALVWKNIYKGGGHPGDYTQVGSEEGRGRGRQQQQHSKTVIKYR